MNRLTLPAARPSGRRCREEEEEEEDHVMNGGILAALSLDDDDDDDEDTTTTTARYRAVFQSKSHRTNRVEPSPRRLPVSSSSTTAATAPFKTTTRRIPNKDNSLCRDDVGKENCATVRRDRKVPLPRPPPAVEDGLVDSSEDQQDGQEEDDDEDTEEDEEEEEEEEDLGTKDDRSHSVSSEGEDEEEEVHDDDESDYDPQSDESNLTAGSHPASRPRGDSDTDDDEVVSFFDPDADEIRPPAAMAAVAPGRKVAAAPRRSRTTTKKEATTPPPLVEVDPTRNRSDASKVKVVVVVDEDSDEENHHDDDDEVVAEILSDDDDDDDDDDDHADAGDFDQNHMQDTIQESPQPDHMDPSDHCAVSTPGHDADAMDRSRENDMYLSSCSEHDDSHGSNRSPSNENEHATPTLEPPPPPPPPPTINHWTSGGVHHLPVTEEGSDNHRQLVQKEREPLQPAHTGNVSIEENDTNDKVTPPSRVTETSTRAEPNIQRVQVFRREGSIRRGQWKLGAKIGVGAFGVVHVGMNTVTGTLMAVKSVKMEPSSMKDAESEIQLLKTLHHDNIVRYLGAEMDATHLHIFQEWVPAGSVTTMLSKFGPFPLTVVRNYFLQMLQGLRYLHTNHIMHRDIKGSNILVNDDGIVKLADFGASKRFVMLKQDMMMSLTMRGSTSSNVGSFRIFNNVSHLLTFLNVF